MHNVPSVWGTDAALFRPGRWLEAQNPHELDRHLTAFSKDKRMCIGIKSVSAIQTLAPSRIALRIMADRGTSLAHAEIYLTLAVLFSSFDMELAAERYPGEAAANMRAPDFLTRTYVNGGPRVGFRPRLGWKM